jgi:hypothetical protein
MTEYPTQLVARFVFEHESVDPWTLGLCLLQERLIESLTVTTVTSPLKLILTRLEKGDARRRPLASLNGDVVQVRASETDLAFWIHFFLTYVRDGFGPVDHIDVETLPFDQSTGRVPDVVFQVRRSGPSLSPDSVAGRTGQSHRDHQ